MRALILSAALVTSIACGAVVPAHLDQQRFDGVHRAARAVRENVNTGVTLLTFRELTGTYATEVSLANDKASSVIEKQFLTLHSAALGAYRDSLTVWNEKLTQNNGPRIYANISQTSRGLERLADDYPIEVKRDGTLVSFEADPAMQTMWSRASAKLDAADAIYRGQEPPGVIGGK